MYENRLMELSSQVMLSQRKTHESMKELTSKDEELVIMKVELASLRERYHCKDEEVLFYSRLFLMISGKKI